MDHHTGPDHSTPAVTAVPGYTYDGTIHELTTLGVVFESDSSLTQQTILTTGRHRTPYAIKLVALYDHEMLHRIMTAIRDTDEPARIIWRETLGRISITDPTTRGKDTALTELARLMPQYERLLAINPIDAAIKNTGRSRNRHRAFWNLKHSLDIENQTGIIPGDANYNLVQANLIHVNIMRPKKYDAEDVQPYLQTNHADIAFIAEHIAEALRLLPELYEREDASADAIKTMLNVKPVLAEGAL